MSAIATELPTFLRSIEKNGWIALGFRQFAMDRLKQFKQVYFISWSQNFMDYNCFPPCEIRFFCHDRMGMTKREEDKEEKHVVVTVEGPWDPLYLRDTYLPASIFKTQEEVDLVLSNWGHHVGILPDYPLRMWLAKVKP